MGRSKSTTRSSFASTESSARAEVGQLKAMPQIKTNSAARVVPMRDIVLLLLFPLEMLQHLAQRRKRKECGAVVRRVVPHDLRLAAGLPHRLGHRRRDDVVALRRYDQDVAAFQVRGAGDRID